MKDRLDTSGQTFGNALMGRAHKGNGKTLSQPVQPVPTGLTPFLVGMVRADPTDLQRARLNADKVAQRHGISVAVVRFNLEFWGVR